MQDWNAKMIEEFHAKNGKGVGDFGDQLALLTTTGARSGEQRTTPLMFHRDGDRYVVIASKAGAPDNPAWYHNLQAHPVAMIEVGAESGTETLEVRAHDAEGRSVSGSGPTASPSPRGFRSTRRRPRGGSPS